MGQRCIKENLVKNLSEEEEARSGQGVKWGGQAGRESLFPQTQTPWPRQVKHISLQAIRLCFTNYCFKLQVLLTGCQGFIIYGEV